MSRLKLFRHIFGACTCFCLLGNSWGADTASACGMGGSLGIVAVPKPHTLTPRQRKIIESEITTQQAISKDYEDQVKIYDRGIAEVYVTQAAFAVFTLGSSVVGATAAQQAVLHARDIAEIAQGILGAMESLNGR